MEIHENSKSYTCEDCNVSYTRKESLTRHIKGHTEAQTPKVMIAKKTQIYHCDKCDYNMHIKRYLTSHIKEFFKILFNAASSMQSYIKTSHEIKTTENIVITSTGLDYFT